MKEVRTRAGVGELPIPTDQQGFEDALVQERKWEFAREFTLRSDLIRMGRLAKVLRQAKQDMKDLSYRKGAYANVPKYRSVSYTHLDVYKRQRRGSVVVSFLFGALFFREKNLKSKAVDLILVLIGMFFLYLGSK